MAVCRVCKLGGCGLASHKRISKWLEDRSDVIDGYLISKGLALDSDERHYLELSLAKSHQERLSKAAGVHKEHVMTETELMKQWAELNTPQPSMVAFSKSSDRGTALQTVSKAKQGIEKLADDLVERSRFTGSPLSREQAVAKVLEANPDLYNDSLAVSIGKSVAQARSPWS